MDNNDEDFMNYNITKKKKSKRSKNALKYSKTCAVYGIFDCTCCKKDENDRVVDSVIDETINQPSTSRLSTNEDDVEQNLSDDLFDDDFIDVGTDYIPTTTNVSSSNKLENCNKDISDNLDEKPENIFEYIDTVCKETGYENVEDSEINILNEINLNQSLNESDETIDVSMDEKPATTSDPLTIDETNANNASIKSDVLLVTEEEEEEIDVVNIPADDTQNNLIENSNNQTETVQQEITQNNFKTELSDDENQIIDILNFDNTDLRENLVNNIENSIANMESTSNTNEDEIIDVENLNEEIIAPTPPSPQNNESDPIVRRLRRNQLKRRVRSQITINFRKRPRMLRSVMTIDLINTPRDNSIIEITDSPVVPRKVTEVINVDDDEYEEPNLNTTYSPRRVGLGNCPVCLESLAKKEIMSTICGHVYCSRCIKNVIKTTKKCPNCRKNLTLKSIHPLFI